MYLTHFGLREEPFGVSPDHRFFLETELHREALATLYYGVQQRRGFAMLVGKAGLGKTSVLVKLIETLRGKHETALLPHPYFDRNAILESVLTSLGLEATDSTTNNTRMFFQYLTRLRAADRCCTVIFDEAQNLSHESLEAIRMLSNFETPSEKLLQIILCGQPGLVETLTRPELDQMRQRINLITRLSPMDPGKTREYILHRSKVAGASSALFDDEALDAISVASGGIPRVVNTICFNALTLAYAVNKTRVGLPEVAEALRDLDLTGPEPRSGESAQPEIPQNDSRISAAATPTPSALPTLLVEEVTAPRSPGFVNLPRSMRTALISVGILILAGGAVLFPTTSAIRSRWSGELKAAVDKIERSK